MKARLPFQIYRKQYFILFICGIIALLYYFSFYFYKKNFQESEVPNVPAFIVHKSNPLSPFNPNDLDSIQWQKLGFSSKQVKTILSYKQLIGGKFKNKEQIEKCYVISKEKYAQIAPYLWLPEEKNSRINTKIRPIQFSKRLNIHQPFQPDKLSLNDWEKIGFSSPQAKAILKYKNFLGGSFKSKENFRKCFVISSENYQQIERYLLLPEKNEEINTPRNKINSISFEEFDPNLLSIEGWKKLGFSEKQAAVIVNYRDKNLKGQFSSEEDLKSCFVISEEKFQLLKPYIRWSTPKKSITQNQNIDFSSTDLNTLTFKELLAFGFDDKSAASILAFRKKLGGFIQKKQLLETYNIDKNKAEKLIAVIDLSSSNVEKHTLADAPEEWLKKHPYFRYYAERIIFLRLSFPQEKELIKKLNPRTEDWEKMKLYLN